MKDSDDVYVFYCRDWLSDEMEDKTLSKMLQASEAGKFGLRVNFS